MAGSTQPTHFRFWLWLIAVISVIVPRRLAARVGSGVALPRSALAETSKLILPDAIQE